MVSDDGRQAVNGHGRRDMPILGQDYQLKAGGDYVDQGYGPDAYVSSHLGVDRLPESNAGEVA